jgi:hypothetical protein
MCKGELVFVVLDLCAILFGCLDWIFCGDSKCSVDEFIVCG